MKILNILADGPSELSTRLIDIQGKSNDVKIIDLSKKDVSYEVIIDEIASADKIISW